MSAIEDAEKAMRDAGEKHETKFMDLWGNKGGDFWTGEHEQKRQSKSHSHSQSKSEHLNWVSVVHHDGRPVEVERFQTQAEAREHRNRLLEKAGNVFTGMAVERKAIIRNAKGNKVDLTVKVEKANSPKAKAMLDRLPKVHTKIKEQKPHQLGLFG